MSLARSSGQDPIGEGRQMRDRFAALLNDFSGLARHRCPSGGPLVDQFRTLLDQFGELRERAVTIERQQSSDNGKHFNVLLEAYSNTLERYRRQQEQVADDFNLLDVLQLTGNEIRHSMVLAWLLDWDIRKLGTHAQGSLGFRLFIEEFDELRLSLDCADCKYWVRREVVGGESIVDVEVACRGKFLMHIENKIWSSEGKDQTDREWFDVQRRAVELNVSERNVCAIFLTPHGAEPTNRKFHPISWGRVIRVFERFGDLAKPADVRLFARHYTRALRRFIVDQDIFEDENAERTLKRS